MLAGMAAAAAVMTTLFAFFGWDSLRRRPRTTAGDRIRRGTLGGTDADAAPAAPRAAPAALDRWLARAGRAGVGPAMLAGAAAAGGVGAAGLMYALVGGDVAPLAAGLAGAALAPVTLARFRENARRELLDQQFEQAIEQLVAALRAGATLHQAFEHVAAEAPMPLAAEFRIVAQRMAVAPIDEAIAMLNERMPGPATRMFVTAVQFQAGTGGPLTDVLIQVADLLRQRREFKLQVAAATAEGRLTAWLMAGMPAVLLGAFRVMAPGYLATLTGAPWGQLLIVGALAMVAVGVVVVQRMAAAVVEGGDE